MALGAVAPRHLAHCDPVSLQMGPKRRCVEGVDPERDMVHVPAVRTRGAAAHAAELTLNRHQIDQGPAGA